MTTIPFSNMLKFTTYFVTPAPPWVLFRCFTSWLHLDQNVETSSVTEIKDIDKFNCCVNFDKVEKVKSEVLKLNHTVTQCHLVTKESKGLGEKVFPSIQKKLRYAGDGPRSWAPLDHGRPKA